MINRLKRSFVRVTMLSAALVLAILMGIVNLTNYIERTNSDMEILAFLAENGGSFPDGGKKPLLPSAELSGGDASAEASDAAAGGALPGPFWGRDDHHKVFTEETPYETRYFSVLLHDDGSTPSVDTSQIAALTGTEAAELALSLEPTSGGRSGSYRYMTVETDEGVLYVFLDCTRNINAVRTFLTNSVIVTAAGLAVLYLIARGLSGRAVRPIAESYEKQRSFITNAGHELKTPLAVIESSAEVIELENGESRWTKSIHGQVERLSRLTQELIELSRMDEGAASLVLSEIDISEAVAEALEPFSMLAERKGLSFTADIRPDIRLRSNREALEKLCAILADNAVKYASEGGDITFTLRRDGGRVLLRAENPADGIEPGKREELFDRFYRGDASRSSDRPGYGLGLPLARSIASALGGRITAESPDGKRLIFTVQLS